MASFMVSWSVEIKTEMARLIYKKKIASRFWPMGFSDCVSLTQSQNMNVQLGAKTRVTIGV